MAGLVPRGLTRNLFDRIRERTRQELTQRVVDPAKERIKDYLGFDPEPNRKREEHVPATDRVTKEWRIEEAARARKLLHMKYNGIWRHVMPMSFRRGKTEKLLYAYCEKDNWDIEAFKISKIEDCEVTDKNWPFTPEYTVEF